MSKKRAKPQASAEFVSQDGEPWRVQRMDLLRVEFEGVDGEDVLPAFLVAAQSSGPRRWMIVRRLFGIMPIHFAGHHPDDLRTWNRGELCAALGIEASAMQEELDSVRGHWMRLAADAERSPEVAVSRPVEAPVSQPAVADPVASIDRLMEEHGFKEFMADEGEEAWFRGRVGVWAAGLAHAQAVTDVRAMLLAELELRRLDRRIGCNGRDLSKETSEGKRKQLATDGVALQKQRKELLEYFADLQVKVDKIFPWMDQAGQGVTMRGIFTDIVRGSQDYHGRADSRLIDGMNATGEIQVLMRTSIQAPEPQYRAGQVVFVNMAKAGLWDPNWKCPLPDSAFKKMDAGWRAAAKAVSENLGEEPVDLMSDDLVKGEFPDLEIPGITDKPPALTTAP